MSFTVDTLVNNSMIDEIFDDIYQHL